MTREEQLKLIECRLDIMELKNIIHELQLEVFKLKNPEHKDVDITNYEITLLRKRLGKDGD